MTTPKIRTHWQPFYMTTPTVPEVQPYQSNGQTTQGANTFSADELNAATEKGRKEAHDRLYGRIEELNTNFKASQEQLAKLQAERDTEAQAKAKADQEAAAAAKAKEEDEADLRELIKKANAEAAQRAIEYEARFTQQNEELAKRDALLAKERELAELDRYRISRVAELREPDPANNYFGIVPNLIEIVDAKNAWGSTQAEVDSTITLMQNQTRSILEGMQQSDTRARAQAPGVAPTAGNVGAMEHQASTVTYSADDIARMPVNSPEYQALRKQYGMARPTGTGIFG